jgi:hypothetical protein
MPRALVNPRLLAAVALLAAAVAAPAAPPVPDELAAALDAGLALRPAGPERAAWAAGLLRGAPYGSSPLGEGVAPDPDPRFRLDRFDCVTFVETALALGASASVADARVVLDDIRYEGAPAFGRRSHYVEAQWIPRLAAKGWIEDDTARVGASATRTTTLLLTRARWRSAAESGRVIRGLDPDALPVGEFPVSYVPLEALPGVAGRIEPGTVAIVVRAPRPDRPYQVTHMGLVVREGGRLVVRHASPVLGKVVDEPLDRFLARLGRQRAWPVLGLSLWRIDAGRREGPPRCQRPWRRRRTRGRSPRLAQRRAVSAASRIPRMAPA